MFTIRCTKSTITITLSALLMLALTPLSAESNHENKDKLPNMFTSSNAHGKDATYSTAGFIDLTNPFFKSLGSNGRSCASCHIPSQGWTITPQGIQAIFDKTA